MTKNITLPVLILMLTLSGCERVQLEKPFSGKVGERFLVDNKLSFSIDSINDYRCPLQVVCVWSGDVKVFCTFYEPHNQIDTAIYLVNARNSIDIGGYNFKLLSVKPQSQNGELIPQNEYELEIIIQKD